MEANQQKTWLVDQITQVAEPLCQGENCELVHVEIVVWNRQTTIRVYADKSGGITLGDCADISRQLGDLLDVHIPDMGSYRLEVSSPGPQRPLKKKQDFHRFKGSVVKIETRAPIHGKKKFTGVLEHIHDDAVVIAVDTEQVEIADPQIIKANLAGQ
ncbi:MAG: ribosome maturation factor RimP [Desulfotignum sp.]|nr:ribosome maturation factor RimP [Desulfotignum sp.]MCF8113389.1 ribosome maturation factor RimP [Desulfotignum sp.]MCF8125102.1 ribosome maturation factor RimP [Desulfotignum sp.]